MTLPISTLQALAALNPSHWPDLSQEDLDSRVEQAGLGPLLCRPRIPSPGPYGGFGIGKTVVTNAVLARVEKDDLALFHQLSGVYQSAREQDRECLMFEWLERYCQSRRRKEELNIIAQGSRMTCGTGDDGRAM